MPCVDFTKYDNGFINANITIIDGGITLVFNIGDYEYQPIIETLEVIWPNWFDFDQYMDKLGGWV